MDKIEALCSYYNKNNLLRNFQTGQSNFAVRIGKL